MIINERVFSDRKFWIVKELDPAQDTLTLESIPPSFLREEEI
jgi:hypothetical protein